MKKYRCGSDGMSAYERITSHNCKQQDFGFAEAVDFIFETDKKNMYKGDRVIKGSFLRNEWRSAEHIVGTSGGVYKCRTVKR